MGNHNKITSFLTAKCPRCGEGKVFQYGPYHPKFIEVNKACSSCGLKFEPEPGFYIGAMYFTYAINVALIIMALIVFNVAFDEFSPFYCFVATVIVVVLFFNFIIRVSRLLMLNIFGVPKS